MKKILNRLRSLLLLSFFVMLSCQEDYVEYNAVASSLDGNSRIITLEELKTAKPKAYEQVKQFLKPGLEERTISYKDYGFTIDNDGILLYENGVYESLTFMIVRDSTRNYLENLVLNKEADDSYSAYHIAYDYDESEQELLASGARLTIDKIHFSSLRKSYASSLLSRGGYDGEVIIGDDGKCYVVEGVRATQWYTPEGQRDWIEVLPGLREVPCPEPEEDWDFNYGNPADLPTYIPIPFDPGPSTGPGVGGVPPRNPVRTGPFVNFKKKKECKKIADLMILGSPSYQAEAAAMAPLVSDTQNEHGFAFDTNNQKISFIPAHQIDINGNGSQFYNAIHHIHNDAQVSASNPTGGTYSIFSYEDLYAIMQLLRNNRIDTDTFVATLSTHKGTHYALTISDVTKFKEYWWHEFNPNLGAMSPPDMQKYSDKLDRERQLSNIYFNTKTGAIRVPNVNNELMLKYFLKFMSDADIGISLFETDATFQHFSLLSRDSNGNIIKDSCLKK